MHHIPILFLIIGIIYCTMKQHPSYLETHAFSSSSTWFFARPSFLEGFARPFDIDASLNLYNEGATDLETDFYAILSDWVTVGGDLRHAIRTYEQSAT